MARVLVTGGTGVLGRELTPRLRDAGHTVRLMSRRAARPGEDVDVEWAQVDLQKGEGLVKALAGVDVVLHAASSPYRRTRQVDVDGTRLLLDHASRASVNYFLYISIVGIDQIPLAYYQHKLAAERVIEALDVPWSILRATQFHDLLDWQIGILTRLPVAFVPTDFLFQVIDTGEVAQHLVSCVEAGALGRQPDVGGPEVLRLGDMTRIRLQAQNRLRPIVHLPLIGKIAAGFRQGLNTTPGNRAGTITWKEWVYSKYES